MSAIGTPVARTGHRPTCFSWILLNDFLGEDNGDFAVGGLALVATAGAALLIGDAVYVSGAGFTVNKSITAANGLLRCGVIVGGVPRSVESGTLEVLQRFASTTSTEVGGSAGVLNDPVLICIAGLCYVVADSAITAGTQIAPSTTTAGRVRPATAAAITAGATAVTSAAANGAADITGDGINAIIGMAVDASTGAGDIIRALVSF